MKLEFGRSMGFWKDKVVASIKRVLFEKDEVKKASAAHEICTTFDASKVEIDRELEQKMEELRPKVLEIYEACSPDTKVVVKDQTEAGVKKETAGVNMFLKELAKIDFPGAKLVSEASAKYGPLMVSGPIFFLFQKVLGFLPIEEPTTSVSMDKDEPTEASSTIVVEKDTHEEKGKKEPEVLLASSIDKPPSIPQ